jgi:hypothetical protein
LTSSATRRVDNIQVGGADDDPTVSDRELATYDDAAPDSALDALEVVFASGQPCNARVGDWVSAQYRVAMKRGGVLADQPSLFAGPSGKFEVLDSEDRIRRDGFGQNPRNVPVSRAQHPVVELIEKQDIGVFQNGMRIERLDYSVEPRPALDVPLNNAEERAEARSCLLAPIDPRLVEQSSDLFTRRTEVRVAKLPDGAKAAEPFDQFLVILVGWLGIEIVSGHRGKTKTLAQAESFDHVPGPGGSGSVSSSEFKL